MSNQIAIIVTMGATKNIRGFPRLEAKLVIEFCRKNICLNEILQNYVIFSDKLSFSLSNFDVKICYKKVMNYSLWRI